MTRNGLASGITRVLSEWGATDFPEQGREAILKLCDEYTASFAQRAIGKISTTMTAVIDEVQRNGLAPVETGEATGA